MIIQSRSPQGKGFEYVSRTDYSGRESWGEGNYPYCEERKEWTKKQQRRITWLMKKRKSIEGQRITEFRKKRKSIEGAEKDNLAQEEEAGY